MRKILAVLCALAALSAATGCAAGEKEAVSEPAASTEQVTEATEKQLSEDEKKAKVSEANSKALEVYKAGNRIITEMYGYEKGFDMEGFLEKTYDTATETLLVKQGDDGEWETGTVYGCDFDKFGAALKEYCPDITELKRVNMKYMSDGNAFVVTAVLTADGICGTYPAQSEIEKSFDGETNYTELYENGLKIVLM